MPRLSTIAYLVDRSDLLADWHTKVPVLSRLSFVEQRTLHDYFAFTKQLTDNEARAHRKAVTAADPSLPHRAGKAIKRFAVLSSIDWAAERRKQEAIGHKRQHLKMVRMLVRPELDLDKIAGAMLTQLMDELQHDQDEAA